MMLAILAVLVSVAAADMMDYGLAALDTNRDGIIDKVIDINVWG